MIAFRVGLSGSAQSLKKWGIRATSAGKLARRRGGRVTNARQTAFQRAVLRVRKANSAILCPNQAGQANREANRIMSRTILCTALIVAAAAFGLAVTGGT